MTAPELFYKFLVDQGILFRFLTIVNNTEYKTLENYCNGIDTPVDYLFGFNWVQSEEGFKYWRKINDAWEQVWIEETTYEK